MHVDGPAFYNDTARKTERATGDTIAAERPVVARVSGTNTQEPFGNSRRRCNPRRVSKNEYVKKRTDPASMSAMTVEGGRKRRVGSKRKRNN
jgi:hypothetical protein